MQISLYNKAYISLISSFFIKMAEDYKNCEYAVKVDVNDLIGCNADSCEHKIRNHYAMSIEKKSFGKTFNVCDKSEGLRKKVEEIAQEYAFLYWKKGTYPSEKLLRALVYHDFEANKAL